MGHVYPDEIRQFIVQNMADLSTVAFSRAIERRNPDLRGNCASYGRKHGHE
jgi:hypothetical protein